ncbi:MAG: CDP-glycerol glycerophosphotransferase family protein [Parachlamydiaceae bacterium]
MKKKCVGINPSAQIHYIDHLAVICVLMDIPLIFIDPNDYALGVRYYPGLEALAVDYQDLTPEYLIANYDVLFMSDLWDRKTFHEKYASLEKQYNKSLRHVHCPHGFSDKGFYLKKCVQEDITLIYGQNMIDQLKHYEVFDDLNEYVITGNYRYTYFKQYREFYDDIVAKEVLSRFARKQPIILYAPTWLDLEESTTFFEAYSYILGNLPDDYNLIVKLHPRLELDDMAHYYHIIGKFEHKPNIVFLKDFPLVYPLLACTDIYLGDMSSVGYDFLPFNKPMFFLNKQRRDSKTDRGLYLFRCGVEIKPDAYPLIYKFIEVNLPNDQERFTAVRKEVYTYTFGEERQFADIKKDIVAAYNR